MDEWKHLAWIAISLLLGSALVYIVVGYGHMTGDMNRAIEQRENTKIVMQEYRRYNGYNEKVVYSQDVASLIMEERGDLYVSFRGAKGLFVYSNNDTVCKKITGSVAPDMEYTAVKVMESLDVNKVYYGHFYYGDSGELLGIQFKEGTMNGEIFVPGVGDY